MAEAVKTPTIERVAKLEALGEGLEKAVSSLNREPPVIIFHPSRLPPRLEFNELFAISRGNAVEHDVRKFKARFSKRNVYRKFRFKST